MQGLELLPISEDKRNRIGEFAQQYERFANIRFKVLEADEKAATVRVVQHFNNQHKYQDKKGLIERGKDLFKGEVPEGYKIHIRAIPYTEGSTDQVDLEWIHEQMVKFQMEQKDLVKHLGVDRHTISRLLTGEQRELTKFQRAAFYYFFLSLKKKTTTR